MSLEEALEFAEYVTSKNTKTYPQTFNCPRREDRKKKKAIEPIISSLLLIAICVGASVLLMGWVMGSITSLSKNTQTNFQIELVEFKTSNGAKNITELTIRNTGTEIIMLKRLYINNKPYNLTDIVQVKDITKIIIVVSPEWTANTLYNFDLYCDIGFKTTSTVYSK